MDERVQFLFSLEKKESGNCLFAHGTYVTCRLEKRLYNIVGRQEEGTDNRLN